MEVGGMDKKEVQFDVPWIPTTPAKPVLQKPAPICTPVEGNQLIQHHNENGVFACFENEKTCEQKTASDDVSCWSDLGSVESHNGLKDLSIPSGDPHGTFDIASCSERTSQNSPLPLDNAIQVEINMEEKDQRGEKDVSAKNLDNDGTPPNKELCNPVVELSAVSSPLKENQNPDEESSQYLDLNKTPQQKPKRRKIRPKVIKEGKPKRSRKPVTPKPVQSKETPTGKRKYVRRKGLVKAPTTPTEVTAEFPGEIPEPAKMSCTRSLNFDIEAIDENSAGSGNTTTLVGKENVVVIQETSSGFASDLNASVKHASNSPMSLPEDTPAPDTSSQRTLHGAQLKENSNGKRRYVRKRKMKTSVPPTEVRGELPTEIKECYAVKENATKHLCKESIVTQETNPDHAYDVNTFMMQASQSYMPLTEDTTATNTFSRGNPHGPKDSPTVERKYVRRSALKKSSIPTEGIIDLTGELVRESAKVSRGKSLNFDKEARDESSADRESASVHPFQDINSSMRWAATHNYMSFPDEQTPSTPAEAKPKENLTGKQKYVRRKQLNKSLTPEKQMAGERTEAIMPESKEISRRRSSTPDIETKHESSACREISDVRIGNMEEETPVGLAYNQDSWMKQALNSYRSLPEDTQAQSTYPSKHNPPGAKPKENPTCQRKYVRKKKMNKTSTPTEMTGELAEPIMSDSFTTISCGRSLNFDKGERGESNMWRESLTCDQNTLVKEALYNYMSLSENRQAPSTSLPQSNPPGAKLKANSEENTNKRKGLATAQDGNISNCQISTIGIQTVGYKRKHYETITCEANSSMNLIGAHYNGLSSYQSKFSIQFPNIQKKRRTEKGKPSSKAHITSSKTEVVEVTEDAQAQPYALNSNCWVGGSAYNALININNAQTFEEFRLSLRRLTERSQSPAPTCDCNSLTMIRNIEPTYTAKHLGTSDWLTFGIADRPQTCSDNLVEEVRVSCAKKKRNTKRSALSRPTHSNTDEMQLAFGGADRPETCSDNLVEEVRVSCAKKKRNTKRSALSHSTHSNTNEMQLALGNHHRPLMKSSDIVHQVTWRTIKALAEQFRQLNINKEVRDLVLHQQNALVPFQDSFDPIRKYRPRPKVELDEETDRVWKLLMLDINHDGIDGTDEDKAKWWEEERNVFRGRADSFIARMHLVQGDRRFSKWKGSVLDSVVGVFLTQNVSDHLSSSAFMSLAARFPKKASSTCKTYHSEGTSLVVNEQVHIVEPEENSEWDVKLLNQPVYGQSYPTVDLVEHSGEKADDSNDSCKITSSVISLTDESNCKLSESSQNNIKEPQCPMVMNEKGEEKSCYDGARKEVNDIVSSQSSVISSQLSGEFSNDQNPEKIGSCSDSNSEIEDLSSTAKHNSCTSFTKLLEMVSSTKSHEVNSQRSKPAENFGDAYGQFRGMEHDNAIESLKKSNVTQGSSEESTIPSYEYNLKPTHNSGVLEVNSSVPFKTETSSSGFLKNKDENGMNRPSFQTAESSGHVAVTTSQTIASQVHPQEQSNHMQQSFFNISGQTQHPLQKERGLHIVDHKDDVRSATNEVSSAPKKMKSGDKGKEKRDDFNWDSLRINAQAKAGKRKHTENTMDSLDWEAVRCADVKEIADTIKERGMNNRLADRIKNFLDRLVEDHGSIDLEWLRDVPPDQVKEYLLSVRGLGLKSVECVRLLTLHHLAFPVDTNVGRIAVRLGWVPLQPLPESLQLHLLELYPVLESIQKYLWPRLCKLDQKTLYELHYQMITFGKVFCTKSKPNCNACPMRGECRHFASAFASARLALPGPEAEERSIVSSGGNSVTDHHPSVIMNQLHLSLPENTNHVEEIPQTEVSRQLQSISEPSICQPIIEEPTSPEPECSQVLLSDMEDAFYEDSGEIPTIKLNIEEFTLNIQNYMQENMELQESEMSKALVALNPEAASIPVPKLKNISRLRTEHCVYELPDTHPLLEGWDTREPDDPGKYLLAIWTPGETANSIEPPERKCSSHEKCGQLCNEKECFSCNSFREANSQMVRGTFLIPCRTAMRGSFPLNGTYFQVNEVFADHVSSLEPISVPRSWIWNLHRRTVYFGTSIPTIFKGLTTQEIQQCFWRGYVCVRGFDRETRAPRPLMARLHFPASKLAAKTKQKTRKGSSSAGAEGLEPNPEHPELILTVSKKLQESGTA